MNYWLKIWEDEQAVTDDNFFCCRARVWDVAVFLVRHCQILVLLLNLEQTPTGWALPWHQDTIYLIVWRMETHHHTTNCRHNKELPSNTEEFKHCPISEQSHHCLVIVFPLSFWWEMWASLGRVQCVVGRLDCTGLMSGFLSNTLVVPCLIALSPILAFFYESVWGARKLLHILSFYLQCLTHFLAQSSTEEMLVWQTNGDRYCLPVKWALDISFSHTQWTWSMDYCKFPGINRTVKYTMEISGPCSSFMTSWDLQD